MGFPCLRKIREIARFSSLSLSSSVCFYAMICPCPPVPLFFRLLPLRAKSGDGEHEAGNADGLKDAMGKREGNCGWMWGGEDRFQPPARLPCSCHKRECLSCVRLIHSLCTRVVSASSSSEMSMSAVMGILTYGMSPLICSYYGDIYKTYSCH